MFQKLFDLLSFGCHHRRISKPFSAARAQSNGTAQWERVDNLSGSAHYVVCLDCGRKFAYDWSRMRVVK